MLGEEPCGAGGELAGGVHDLGDPHVPQAGRDHLAVDLVGVQAPELLGDAGVEVPHGHGDLLVGLTRLPQHRHGPARALEHDLAVVPDEGHPVEAAGPGAVDQRHVGVEPGAQPRAEQHHAGGAAASLHDDLAHGRGLRLVQDRGQLDPPVGHPGPGQIRVAGDVPGAQLGERLVGVVAARGVRDPPVGDPGDGRGVRRGRRHRVRPPGDDRGVRQQQRREQGLGGLGELAVAVQHDDLGGAGVTAHAQLGVEPGALRLGVRHVHEDPARVLVAREVRGLQGGLGVPGLGEDHEREDPAERDDAVLVPQLAQLLVDGRGGGVLHRNDHGRLQTRPSRASSSSAAAGPQDPGA